VLREGLLLGEVKKIKPGKCRFTPYQPLAMALSPDDAADPENAAVRLSPEDIRVSKYLKGETIEADTGDGMKLVCLDRYPLGWAQFRNGICKNKYNPAWRLMG